MFSVQHYPCDSKPCVNGATCSNDDQDVSLYHCHCTDDYSGRNCQGTKCMLFLLSFFLLLHISSFYNKEIFSFLLSQCLLSAKSLVLKHQAVYYPMHSVILKTLSKTINFNRLSAHALSWHLTRATSSSH